MSTEQNKAIVRRFITEVLIGGNVELVDELLAAGLRESRDGWHGPRRLQSVADRRLGRSRRQMEIEDLVAEGDAVVARFNYAITLPNGESIRARGLTFYRIADGRIVEDDPITTPDLMQAFADQMPAPTA